MLVTLVGAIGLYWLANHFVAIGDAAGLALWNAIVIATPTIIALAVAFQWVFRDKRPYIVVDMQSMLVSLPRRDIRFPVENRNATFVHDRFALRRDDDVSEFNLVFHIGPNEISHPILKILGDGGSFQKIGQALKAAGLQFEQRITSD